MEVSSHKSIMGQDIFFKGIIAFLIILSFNCSSTKQFQLTDASPKFKEFEGGNLDPNKGKDNRINLTNNRDYNDFLLKANKSITTLEFGENVTIQIESKKTAKEPIESEMIASGYLVEDLPSIISDLPNLKNRNLELLDSAPNDFDGSSLGGISSDLSKILDKINILIPKSDTILRSLKFILSDAESYANSKDAKVEIAETILEPKVDSVLPSPEAEKSKTIKKKPTKTQIDTKPKLTINRISKKNKVTGTTRDLIKEEIKEPEQNFTEEEKREIEYAEKIRRGLVDVFKWEYYRKSKKLEALLLFHPIPRVRSAAALALGRLKAGRVALQNAINNDGYQVRPAAFKALADVGDRKSLLYFISGTKAEDVEVIAASYEGLGKTRDPAGREMIISQGLNSEYAGVVAGSLRGLAYNKIQGDVTLIENFLKSSEEKDIKIAAIEALSLHGSREALRILEQNVQEQPDLAMKILDEIGRNKSLSATFSLIRLNETSEAETLKKRIGEHLLRKKAFGKYAIILTNQAVDF